MKGVNNLTAGERLARKLTFSILYLMVGVQREILKTTHGYTRLQK